MQYRCMVIIGMGARMYIESKVWMCVSQPLKTEERVNLAAVNSVTQSRLPPQNS